MRIKKLTRFQEAVGYGGFFTGAFTLVLGMIWFANSFFEVGSPARIERATCVIVMLGGTMLMLSGLLIAWPREKG